MDEKFDFAKAAAEADKEIEDFTGGSSEYLDWAIREAEEFAQALKMPITGVLIVREQHSKGQRILFLVEKGSPFPESYQRALIALYVAEHRYLFEAWRNERALKALRGSAPPKPN